MNKDNMALAILSALIIVSLDTNSITSANSDATNKLINYANVKKSQGASNADVVNDLYNQYLQSLQPKNADLKDAIAVSSSASTFTGSLAPHQYLSTDGYIVYADYDLEIPSGMSLDVNFLNRLVDNHINYNEFELTPGAGGIYK